MSVHLFGIRHHGVGSARSLLAALEALQPDCILIEGPPDADDLIPLVAEEGMQPPVALLVYNPEQPKQSAWYPLAVYSPEWQAMRYGLAHGAAVRFFDLPQRHMMAVEAAEVKALLERSEEEVDFTPEQPPEHFDPLQALAEAAGEPDGERWWSRVVEETRNPAEVFGAIQEAMTALRAEFPPDTQHPFIQRREQLREAWMRRTIRAAEKQYQRIAVVCGAWHTPALAERPPAKADDALLKGLPSVKITATFAPWTYSRLSVETGYGAGIASPGWYHHLWETPASEVPSRWLVRVAALLREEGLLASTAQVIDALRLSDMLAGMRGRSVGLEELNEASVAVLCAGRTEPLNLIRQKLIVGERMGSVPPEVPAVPLQRDVAAWQKRLRLKLSPDRTTLDLDLRQPTDQARSQFFHRLNLLGIPWAQGSRGKVQSKGTFHEFWDLQWSPELDIRVIEANVWGNTVENAAVGYASHEASGAEKLGQVTRLLQAVTLAVLPDVLETVLRRLNDLASLTHDVSELMAGVPPLVDTLRYGDVRQTDSRLIAPVLESMMLRVCVGLYSATLGLDDDAAANVYQRLTVLHSALQVSQQRVLLDRWYEALVDLMSHDAPHPLLSGTATRLLFRAERVNADEAAHRMRRAFSTGHEPHYATYWLEGFLTSMEHVLLQDNTLFNLVDAWVVGLDGEQFDAMLPLLRRTFATYSGATRRSLSERVKRGVHTVEAETIDEARGARVLPIMRQILGLP
jgi:hypothetical protein